MAGLNDFDKLNDFSTKDDEEENNDFEYSDDEEIYDDDYVTVVSPNENFIPLQEKEVEQLRKIDNLSKFDDVFSDKNRENLVSLEKTECTTELTEKEKLAAEHRKQLYVKENLWAVDLITEGVESQKAVSGDKDHIRTAKMGTMPTVTFRKPTESKGILPKLIMLICGCIGFGIFLGIQANSFYILKDGKVESTMSCAFSWIMEENMTTTVSPLYTDIFIPAFLIGCGSLAVIGLLIWLDSDAKKQSRVGHEHGKARLGSSGDFKNYKAKFME